LGVAGEIYKFALSSASVQGGGIIVALNPNVDLLVLFEDCASVAVQGDFPETGRSAAAASACEYGRDHGQQNTPTRPPVLVGRQLSNSLVPCLKL
jgi:hypothetical protein